MFKALIKNLKSTKAQARSPIFSLLLLASLCIFSPLAVHDAHAATNPKGTTVNTMEATTSDPALINYGTISEGKDFGGSRIGMYGQSSSTASFSFNNFGDIMINNAPQFSYGMAANSVTGSHVLTNNGTISLSTLTNGFLYGMQASGNGSHTLTNNGTIILNAYEDIDILQQLHGMRVSGGHQHTLINNGTIIINTVKSSSGMKSANVSANFHNSGYISVRGTNREIFGMYADKITLNISNTGVINVWADKGIASEAFAVLSNLNVGTWATTLRNFSLNDNVFGLLTDDLIPTEHVNFNNSTLILRPGTSAQGFQLGKTYKVADMIKVLRNNWNKDDEIPVTLDHVKGNIAEAVAEVPFLKATLVNGHDPFNATVRLDSNVSEETTPGAAPMQQAVSQVQSQFNNLSASLRNALVEIYTQANLIADAGQNNASGVAAGSSAINNKWQVFLSPHANYVNNSKYDYDGSNMGITAGASYRMSEQFSFGAHLDLSFGDYSGELLDMSTDSTSFALGLHAAYNFTPEWYLRGQVTGAITQNDSEFNVELTSLHGDSRINGEALFVELATGYTWQIAKGHTITPEIGLSYLGTHASAYDIEWSMSGTPMSMYDMNYDDSYYNALYATAHVDWRGEWAVSDNSTLAFMAGLGLRQALTSGDIETSFKMIGSNYTVKSTEDVTTFLVDAGVEYSWDIISLSLNYEGGLGAHQYNHGGNVMLKFEF